MKIKRYDYLDNIKWVLAILVIVHHSASIAGLDPIGFNLPHVIKTMQWQYSILGTLQGIDQSFFMSLFFFISAYFVLPSLTRKRSGRFILDKLKRLGIPTLITIFIILPMVLFFSPMNLSYIGSLNMYASLLKTGNMQLGVTWFCWSLIVFSAFFVIGHKLFSLNKSKSVDKTIPAIWKILLFAVIMIPFNSLGLYLRNLLGGGGLGFHDLEFFPMYIAMFYFGTQAYKYQWLDQVTFKYAFCGILMWIFGFAFLKDILTGYGFNGHVMMRGFSVIGMSMFLIYTFKILFNTKNKWTTILSRTAYAAYVVQVIPLVVVAGIYTPYMTQTPIVNFVVISIPSVLLSFFIAYLICKLPVLKRIF